MHISSEGKLGLLAAVVYGFGSGAVTVDPSQLWMGWTLMAVSVFGATGLGVHHFRELWIERRRTGSNRKIIIFSFIVILALIFVSTTSAYLWPNKPQQALINKLSAIENSNYGLKLSTEEEILLKQFEIGTVPHELGDAVEPPKIVNYASKSVHQKSTVIWISNPSQSLYVIPRGSASWHEIKENSWDFRPIFSDRKERRRTFQRFGIPPSDMHDPYGGIAAYIHDRPAEWENFKWLDWICQSKPSSVFFRRFSKGFAVGPFPPGNGSTAAQIFYFYDLGTFTASILPPTIAVPACQGIADL